MKAMIGLILAAVDPNILNDAGEIGKILLVVAAVAIAMQQVLGSTIQAQVEALQASGLVGAKYGGVAAMGVGILYGLGLGVVASVSTAVNPLTLLVSGVLGGLVAGGGAISVDERIDGVAARKLEQVRAAEARHAETMLELETQREMARVEQARMAQSAAATDMGPGMRQPPIHAIVASSAKNPPPSVPTIKTPFTSAADTD